MSEMAPRNQQFVGSADATREIGKSVEFILSPEQQQVADTLKSSGERLEKSVLDARGVAGEKLKELKGKELVVAGAKQFALGLALGKGAEAAGALISYPLGIGIGALKSREQLSEFGGEFAYLFDSIKSSDGILDSVENMNAIAEEFFGATDPLIQKMLPIGRAVGFEVSGLLYSKLTKEKNMPSVKWFDWIGGQLGLIPLMVNLRGYTLNINPINMITFSALRNVAAGVYQMATGK